MAIIQKGEGNTSGVLVPLIPFNCIVDTDLGLMSLISKYYLDNTFFDIEFFKKNNNIRKMVKSLYMREEENPLLLCMINKDKDIADEYYKEFMEKKYDDILNLSVTTELYSLITIFKTFGDIRSTIICKDKREKDLLSKLVNSSTLQCIMPKDIIETISMYEQFYFKSVDDYYLSILADSIKSKNIYFANYKFNFDGNYMIKDSKYTAILDILRNKCSSIDIYNREKLEETIKNDK